MDYFENKSMSILPKSLHVVTVPLRCLSPRPDSLMDLGLVQPRIVEKNAHRFDGILQRYLHLWRTAKLQLSWIKRRKREREREREREKKKERERERERKRGWSCENWFEIWGTSHVLSVTVEKQQFSFEVQPNNAQGRLLVFRYLQIVRAFARCVPMEAEYAEKKMWA